MEGKMDEQRLHCFETITLATDLLELLEIVVCLAGGAYCGCSQHDSHQKQYLKWLNMQCSNARRSDEYFKFRFFNSEC